MRDLSLRESANCTCLNRVLKNKDEAVMQIVDLDIMIADFRQLVHWIVIDVVKNCDLQQI